MSSFVRSFGGADPVHGPRGNHGIRIRETASRARAKFKERCMNIYVGNIPRTATEQDLRAGSPRGPALFYWFFLVFCGSSLR